MYFNQSTEIRNTISLYSNGNNEITDYFHDQQNGSTEVHSLECYKLLLILATLQIDATTQSKVCNNPGLHYMCTCTYNIFNISYYQSTPGY